MLPPERTVDWQTSKIREQELAKQATAAANAVLRPAGFEARVVLYPLEQRDAA